ncbi:MAG: hypothetical protein ACJA2Q_002360 [Pseudohongiellaceae bacterium]|jgi:hypothetical protein
MFSQLSIFLDANDRLLLTLGAFSFLAFVATLAIVPWLVAHLPANYFKAPQRRSALAQRLHPALRIPAIFLKNCLGLLILVLGIIMLVIPGQGLLTMLIGTLLMDFPGKFRFERWLVQKNAVLSSINWLRRREGKAPLLFED